MSGPGVEREGLGQKDCVSDVSKDPAVEARIAADLSVLEKDRKKRPVIKLRQEEDGLVAQRRVFAGSVNNIDPKQIEGDLRAQLGQRGSWSRFLMRAYSTSFTPGSQET